MSKFSEKAGAVGYDIGNGANSFFTTFNNAAQKKNVSDHMVEMADMAEIMKRMRDALGDEGAAQMNVLFSGMMANGYVNPETGEVQKLSEENVHDLYGELWAQFYQNPDSFTMDNIAGVLGADINAVDEQSAALLDNAASGVQNIALENGALKVNQTRDESMEHAEVKNGVVAVSCFTKILSKAAGTTPGAYIIAIGKMVKDKISDFVDKDYQSYAEKGEHLSDIVAEIKGDVADDGIFNGSNGPSMV